MGSYESLSYFAFKNMKPLCTVHNLGACDEGNKTLIEKFMDMSSDVLDRMVMEIEDKVELMEDDFNHDVGRLNDIYEKIEEEGQDRISNIKNKGHYEHILKILTLKKRGTSSATTGDEL